MAEQQTGERTEQATPRKRKQAREKGTVARSTDLNSSSVMFALAILLPTLATGAASAMLQSMRNGLRVSEATADIGAVGAHFWSTVQPMIAPIIPILIVSVVTGVSVGFMQVGFKPTLQPLQPKLERLNPVNGVKRLLSRQSAFEFLKTVIKLVLIGYIAFADVKANQDELLGLAGLAPRAAIGWTGAFIAGIFLKVALAWLVLGVIDYLFQRRTVERQIMMTKDEVKREMKETETSPELRSEMHRRRQRLARSRMMQNVKHADVVVTNPTEYAIALKYDPKKHASPICLAKGRHLTAERIREEAKKGRVPIVPNPPLARSLYEQVEVGDQVPVQLFQAVAEVLAYVFRLKGRKV